MCGIAGILRWDSATIDRDALLHMTNALSHRGPDHGATYIDGQVGIGHRRLAIIDLNTGDQPLFNEQRDIAVVCNGEIYNYRELTAELESRGHHFSSRSDSEVIVHAWEEWGTQCVTRLRGMFAFAVVDWRARQVFLARDHFGMKPLVYFVRNGVLAFASEIQALRTLSEFPSELDYCAIDHYLRLRYIPNSHCVYKHVTKLPPAHTVTVCFDGTVTTPTQYWTPTYGEHDRLSIPEAVDKVHAVLQDSVQHHLVADVPVGMFLSGGLDSTAIASLARAATDRSLHTFSVGFESDHFDERPYARLVAERYRTEHHEFVVAPDAIEVLPKLMQHYGEPFGDWSALATYYLAKHTRHEVTVALSGDGGDEALAGYPWHLEWLRLFHPDRSGWRTALKNFLAPILAPFVPPPWNLQHWFTLVSTLDSGERAALWRPEYRTHVDTQLPTFETTYQAARSHTPIRCAQAIDYATFLPDDILVKVDRTSMANSLELRSPFLDYRVAEFAATLPGF